MGQFKDFERRVIGRLAAEHLTERVLEAVFDSADLVSVDYTGHGYCVTVRHPELPGERATCSQPTIVGRSGGLQFGFLVFLGNHELTLECHPYADPLPADVRECDVVLETAN